MGSLDFLEELEEVIRDRLREMPEDSYTALLARRGVGYTARKLGEEAVETIVEALQGSRETLVYESADLLYHLMVLLALRGASIRDVVSELERRHKERAGSRGGGEG